jgi:hypothetical protein
MELGASDLDILREFCEASRPLLGCWMGPDLIALGGVVPVGGLLSRTGHAWIQSTYATERHKIALARIGPMIAKGMRPGFDRLIGTCSLGPRSVNWLKSMGAKFIETDGIRKPFVMEITGG